MSKTRFPTKLFLAGWIVCLINPPAFGFTPPFSDDLVLWFDASDPASLTVDTNDEVTQWRNRVVSGTMHFLQTAPDKSPPEYRPSGSAFGDSIYFGGSSVMELVVASDEGPPERTDFTTTDGLAVFVVSRGESVGADNVMSWQATFAWTQNEGLRNAITRDFYYEDGSPAPYPEGDIHYYYGSGSPVLITDILMGSKISGNGTLINVLKDVEIAEVLFYQRGLTGEERDQIMVWLSQRHGLSTDRTNPVAHLDPRSTPLKSVVPENSGFRIAAAANSNFFRVNQNISNNFALARYAATESTLERHYQLITPTNDFKMSEVGVDLQTTDDKVPHDWMVTDPYVEWAAERKIEIHGHTLIWHRALPNPLAKGTWLNGEWTEAQLRSLLYNHIDEMMSRYTPDGDRPDLAGTVTMWDVVNEAIAQTWNWNPNEGWQAALRSSLWLDGGDKTGPRPGLGPGFVAEAFHRARLAAGTEEISLLYNDFHTEEINPKSDAIYLMCVDLLDQGVPIDGVGFQMHINFNGLDLDSFRQNIERFRALRNGTFEVHITELDIGIPGLVTREKLEEQGDLFRDILLTAIAADVQSFSTWGVHDIWYSGARGYEAGLPFSKTMRLSPEAPYPGNLPLDHPSRRLSFIEPKPGFYGLLEGLKEAFGPRPYDGILNGFRITSEKHAVFELTVSESGIIDFLSAPDLGGIPHPVGTEEAWETYSLEQPQRQSFEFSDPGWDGSGRRFWTVIFSPRR